MPVVVKFTQFELMYLFQFLFIFLHDTLKKTVLLSGNLSVCFIYKHESFIIILQSLSFHWSFQFIYIEYNY